MFLENSPIISTLISRFRLHAMHVDVSTINHKFDQRVPSFSSSFYFSPPLKESFSKETVREREREGRWSDARQLRATRCRTRKVFLSETRSREVGSAGWVGEGRGRGKVARKKQRKEESSNSMERYLHCAQWKILGSDLSQLDGLVCHDASFIARRTLRAIFARMCPCIRKGRSF